MSTRHSFLSTTGLIRPDSATSMVDGFIPYHHHARASSTKPGKKTSAAKPPSKPPLTTKAGIRPLGPTFLVTIALFLSMLFVFAVSCAFIPDEEEKPAFATALDDIANNSPGIVLIGDDVDVDIDEPALTIRWSIIGCGPQYILSGSEGTHGSNKCGLPAMALRVFADGNEEPAGLYNPSALPFYNGSEQRHSIQNMFQFDDDHVLDVHNTRLYPFDTYRLTSSLRVVSAATNETLPLQMLATISQTSSFLTMSSDSSSVIKNTDGTEQSSRDIDLLVSRPAEARAFAILLFAASWMLAHATIGCVVLSWRTTIEEKVLRYLAATFVILFLIPQLRNAMPDAPGLDGVLIDTIGFFPQMLVGGISAIILFGIMVKRELEDNEGIMPEHESRKETPAPLSTSLLKMRRGGASVDISHVRNLSRSLSGVGRSARV